MGLLLLISARRSNARHLSRAERASVDPPIRGDAAKEQPAIDYVSLSNKRKAGKAMPDPGLKISTFFARTLGAPFGNNRWSWGATNPKTGVLFLRVWEDERKTVGGVDRIQIIGSDWSGPSPGYHERVRHVDLLRNGAVTYGVLCVAQSTDAPGPRKISKFDHQNLLAFGGIIEKANSIYALITGIVPVGSVNQRIGIPKGITEEDVIGALQRLANGAPHPFGVSTGWDVIYERNRYPQKAVLGLAAERAAGRPLGPYDFNAGECRRALAKLGFPPLQKGDVAVKRDEEEDGAEAAIRQRTDIGRTEMEQLVNARRGQGVFRSNLGTIEKRCRVTGLKDSAHLRASHIKPWSKCDDRERLDGNNGLLLSPHIDHLFDGGFITFTDSGDLLVADLLQQRVLKIWGILPTLNVGGFRPEQAKYLDYHRREVFLGRTK